MKLFATAGYGVPIGKSSDIDYSACADFLYPPRDDSPDAALRAHGVYRRIPKTILNKDGTLSSDARGKVSEDGSNLRVELPSRQLPPTGYGAQKGKTAKDTIYIERNKKLEIQAITYNSDNTSYATRPNHAKTYSTQFTFKEIGKKCIPDQIYMSNDGTAEVDQFLRGTYLDVPLCKELYDFFKKNHDKSPAVSACRECDRALNQPLARIMMSYNGKHFKWSNTPDFDGWWADLGTMMNLIGKSGSQSAYTVAQRMVDRCQNNGLTPLLKNAKLWEGYEFLGRITSNRQNSFPNPGGGTLPTENQKQ